MTELFTEKFMLGLEQAANIMGLFEMIAVVLALAYLILAIKENSWCWLCGFSSTLIYLIIFWNVSLYSESLLQVFYLYMSGYGWLQWTKYKGPTDQQQASLKPIIKWSFQKHLKVIFSTSVVALMIGFLMATMTDAAFPYVDAATTSFAIVATYMMAQKVFENWYYWIIVDSVSVFLYLNKSLYLTAVLFIFYVVLCFVGIIAWRRHLLPQSRMETVL
jgi:nicotinamide mononucleotide transporter